MKKLMLLAFVITAILNANAQTLPSQVRSISVNGTAEMEVVPDEIYVQVELSEYKKNNTKTDIETIRTAFLTNITRLGYTDKDISVRGYNGWDGNPYSYKKKKTDLIAGITYWVKVGSTAKMDELVNQLDDAATTNFFIAKKSHSKMTEYKKQLKITAIRAAKIKAEYMTEAIDEKIGNAITINEPAEVVIYQSRVSNTALVQDNTAGESMPIIDFNKIKLQFEVNVVFALQ